MIFQMNKQKELCIHMASVIIVNLVIVNIMTEYSNASVASCPASAFKEKGRFIRRYKDTLGIKHFPSFGSITMLITPLPCR
jgi:hypothetical protein